MPWTTVWGRQLVPFVPPLPNWWVFNVGGLILTFIFIKGDIVTLFKESSCVWTVSADSFQERHFGQRQPNLFPREFQLVAWALTVGSPKGLEYLFLFSSSARCFWGLLFSSLSSLLRSLLFWPRYIWMWWTFSCSFTCNAVDSFRLLLQTFSDQGIFYLDCPFLFIKKNSGILIISMLQLCSCSHMAVSHSPVIHLCHFPF